jgi:hypothetical protein
MLWTTSLAKTHGSDTLMIQNSYFVSYGNTPKCLHCEADLAGTVEQAIGELVIRCPVCGRLNVVAVQLQVLGLI